MEKSKFRPQTWFNQVTILLQYDFSHKKIILSYENIKN